MARNRLDEVVRMVIKEYMGHSQEAEEAALEVYSKAVSIVRDEANKLIPFNIGDGAITHKNKFIFKMGDGLVVAVDVFVFNSSLCDYENAREVLISNGFISVNSNTKLNRLSFYLILDENLNICKEAENDSIASLSHECLHLLQDRKGMNMSSDKYKNASMMSKSGIDQKEDVMWLIRYTVPRCAYMASKIEVGAWVQQLNSEAQRVGDVKNTRSYDDITHFIHEIAVLRHIYSMKSLYGKEIAYFDEVCKQIGYGSINGFFNEMEKAKKKYLTMIGKVMAKYHQPSGSFKQYARNEIKPKKELGNGRNKIIDKIKGFFK